MAKDAPTIEKEKGTWLGFFTKLFFFFLIIGVVGIMVLSSLGGNSDVLKGSIEDYLSQRFQGRAQIDEFHQMTFYPYLAVDMEGVNVFEGDSETRTRFSAKKVVLGMGFWDLALGNGKLKTMNIQGMKAAPGTIIAQGLTVDNAAIIDEGDQAYIRSSGKIGATPYNFETHVETHGKGKRKKYSFGDVRPFDANLGDIKLKGRIEDMDVDMMSLKDFSIGEEASVLAGSIDIFYGGDNRFKVKGDVAYGEGSTANVDILVENFTKMKVSGTLDFSEMLLKDALNYSQVIDLLDKIQNIIGVQKKEEPGYDFSNVEMDIQASVEKLVHNDVNIASLRSPIKIENGDLHAGPIQSGFEGAELDSNIYFKTSVKPAQLEYDINLDNWDYGSIEKAYKSVSVAGRANIRADLTSSGNTKDELKSNLNGSFAFVAGEAELPSSALNIWGKGLFNIMLPDFNEQTKTMMNCAIADFKVEKGVANVSALFVDTDDVTIQGEGTYNFPQDFLDISLQPETKSVSIATVSVPVNIEGPLTEPDISTDKLGIVKKIGGLALGFVNPALMAYSLTDLGLTESHPCAEFMGENKQQTE